MDASFSLADFKFGKLPTQSPPLVGYRFGVYFLGGTGVMFPSDFRFSRVSGVGVRISEDEQTQKRAIPVYENLVLERGLPVVKGHEKGTTNGHQNGTTPKIINSRL
jgi:hypothetical protein